jgi:hypothetical protein
VEPWFHAVAVPNRQPPEANGQAQPPADECWHRQLAGPYRPSRAQPFEHRLCRFRWQPGWTRCSVHDRCFLKAGKGRRVAPFVSSLGAERRRQAGRAVSSQTSPWVLSKWSAFREYVLAAATLRGVLLSNASTTPVLMHSALWHLRLARI